MFLFQVLRVSSPPVSRTKFLLYIRTIWSLSNSAVYLSSLHALHFPIQNCGTPFSFPQSCFCSRLEQALLLFILSVSSPMSFDGSHKETGYFCHLCPHFSFCIFLQGCQAILSYIIPFVLITLFSITYFTYIIFCINLFYSSNCLFKVDSKRRN